MGDFDISSYAACRAQERAIGASHRLGSAVRGSDGVYPGNVHSAVPLWYRFAVCIA